MNVFVHWLADGGGEQNFFDACRNELSPQEAILRLQYRKEDLSFPSNDQRRYGPFLADRLIIAQTKSQLPPS